MKGRKAARKNKRRKRSQKTKIKDKKTKKINKGGTERKKEARNFLK